MGYGVGKGIGAGLSQGARNFIDSMLAMEGRKRRIAGEARQVKTDLATQELLEEKKQTARQQREITQYEFDQAQEAIDQWFISEGKNKVAEIWNVEPGDVPEDMNRYYAQKIVQRAEEGMSSLPIDKKHIPSSWYTTSKEAITNLENSMTNWPGPDDITYKVFTGGASARDHYLKIAMTSPTFNPQGKTLKGLREEYPTVLEMIAKTKGKGIPEPIDAKKFDLNLKTSKGEAFTSKENKVRYAMAKSYAGGYKSPPKSVVIEWMLSKSALRAWITNNYDKEKIAIIFDAMAKEYGWGEGDDYVMWEEFRPYAEREWGLQKKIEKKARMKPTTQGENMAEKHSGLYGK